MAFRTDTSADDSRQKESGLGLSSVSPNCIKSIIITEPRGLWFSSGTQHRWKGCCPWRILPSSTGRSSLALHFLICSVPFAFFFASCSIRVSDSWDWELEGYSSSQNWKPQILCSALMLLVPPSWYGSGHCLTGLGSSFLALVWVCLLTWLVETHWSNETLASAH